MAKKRRAHNTIRSEPKQKRNASTLIYATNNFDALFTNGYVRLSENPEIISAVNKIADLVSSMTVYLMENTDSGDIRVRDGLARMIDVSPNPYMTRKTFMSAIVRNMFLEGDGNSVAIPRTRRGLLRRIDLVSAQRCNFVPDGWGYKILIDGIENNPDNLLHFVINPDTLYPWKGTGYRVALSDIAQNLKQATETQKGFMESKWMPSVIVKVDGLIDEFSTKEGRQKILEDYVESSQVGQPWLIPAEQFDVSVVKPLSLQDIAVDSTVKLDKYTVAAVLGVPPFVVGVGDFHVSEWDNFVNSRIKPICNAIEQELTRKLLLSPNRYFKFNIRSLYSYDLRALAGVGANLYSLGIMTGNEVRDWMMLSPKQGLDELMILENYIPQDMSGQQKKLIQDDEQ